MHVEGATGSRRRWPTIVLGAVVLLAASAGGLYAALPRLDTAYVRFTDLSSANVDAIPEFDVQSVFVVMISDPQGADVINEAGSIVGQTPHTLRRRKNVPSERYTFRKEGFHEYSRSFDFDKDSTANFTLEAKVVEPPPTTPVVRPDRPIVRPEVVRPTTAVTPTTPPTTVTKPPEKVPTTPKNPYGTIKKIDDTKANPYGGGSKPAAPSTPKNPYQ